MNATATQPQADPIEQDERVAREWLDRMTASPLHLRTSYLHNTVNHFLGRLHHTPCSLCDLEKSRANS